jgi:hypothetical protein
MESGCALILIGAASAWPRRARALSLIERGRVGFEWCGPRTVGEAASAGSDRCDPGPGRSVARVDVRVSYQEGARQPRLGSAPHLSSSRACCDSTDGPPRPGWPGEAGSAAAGRPPSNARQCPGVPGSRPGPYLLNRLLVSLVVRRAPRGPRNSNLPASAGIRPETDQL